MELYKIEDTILIMIRDRRQSPGTARISPPISGTSRNPSSHPLIISSSRALGIRVEGNSRCSLTRRLA